MKFDQFLKEAMLNEAPLPDDWDKDKFKKGATFKETVAYATERAEKLGTGSSRIVFNIDYKGRETALKIAKNKKGVSQNIEEITYADDKRFKELNLLIPMIDYDNTEECKWVHMEKAEPITDEFFKQYTGGMTCSELVAVAYNLTHRNSQKSVNGNPTKDVYQKSIAYMDRRMIDVLDSLKEFFRMAHSIKPYDLMRVDNWGIYKNKPRIIDIGFNDRNEELYKKGK